MLLSHILSAGGAETLPGWRRKCPSHAWWRRRNEIWHQYQLPPGGVWNNGQQWCVLEFVEMEIDIIYAGIFVIKFWILWCWLSFFSSLFQTLLWEMCITNSMFEMHLSRKALESRSPQEQRGYMFYSAWLFFPKFEKTFCLPSVWIHKPKCERCDRDTEMPGKRWGKRKKVRWQMGIFLSLLRQNCRQCLCMNLAAVDVLERRPWLFVRAAEGFLSQQGMCICMYFILATSINLFFASSPNGESLTSWVESSEWCIWLCIHVGALK